MKFMQAMMIAVIANTSSGISSQGRRKRLGDRTPGRLRVRGKTAEIRIDSLYCFHSLAPTQRIGAVFTAVRVAKQYVEIVRK